MSIQSNQSHQSHEWTWELDHKEGWVLKNLCFWTMVLEKTLESPMDYKEIKPVNPKANPFWIFIWRTNTDTETPILWPPNMKSWLIRKDPDAGKYWSRRRRGWQRTMFEWHHHSMDMTLSKLWEMVKDREPWHATVPGVAENQTWLSNWTTTTHIMECERENSITRNQVNH